MTMGSSTHNRLIADKWRESVIQYNENRYGENVNEIATHPDDNVISRLMGLQ